MERYANILRRIQLVQYAIQHTYDAARDECDELGSQMPSRFYVEALNKLVQHRDELRDELEIIRQEEIIEDEVAQMAILSLRIDRLKNWLDNV